MRGRSGKPDLPGKALAVIVGIALAATVVILVAVAAPQYVGATMGGAAALLTATLAVMKEFRDE